MQPPSSSVSPISPRNEADILQIADLEQVSPPRVRPRRSWREKFGDAFRGIKRGVRGHSSFSVHFFFAALVVAAAVALNCSLIEWCILLGCIGLVLTAELFNSAIETLFRELPEALRDRAFPALDIAAGAVLLASITASIIGTIIFVFRLAIMLNLVKG